MRSAQQLAEDEGLTFAGTPGPGYSEGGDIYEPKAAPNTPSKKPRPWLRGAPASGPQEKAQRSSRAQKGSLFSMWPGETGEHRTAAAFRAARRLAQAVRFLDEDAPRGVEVGLGQQLPLPRPLRERP
jgi:hypothetical protein